MRILIMLLLLSSPLGAMPTKKAHTKITKTVNKQPVHSREIVEKEQCLNPKHAQVDALIKAQKKKQQRKIAIKVIGAIFTFGLSLFAGCASK